VIRIRGNARGHRHAALVDPSRPHAVVKSPATWAGELPAECSGHGDLLMAGIEVYAGDRLPPSFPCASPSFHACWLRQHKAPPVAALLIWRARARPGRRRRARRRRDQLAALKPLGRAPPGSFSLSPEQTTHSDAILLPAQSCPWPSTASGSSAAAAVNCPLAAAHRRNLFFVGARATPVFPGYMIHATETSFFG
jgi:hypothetical protein